jgi:hypothetical protein
VTTQNQVAKTVNSKQRGSRLAARGFPHSSADSSGTSSKILLGIWNHNNVVLPSMYLLWRAGGAAGLQVAGAHSPHTGGRVSWGGGQEQAAAACSSQAGEEDEGEGDMTCVNTRSCITWLASHIRHPPVMCLPSALCCTATSIYARARRTSPVPVAGPAQCPVVVVIRIRI